MPAKKRSRTEDGEAESDKAGSDSGAPEKDGSVSLPTGVPPSMLTGGPEVALLNSPPLRFARMRATLAQPELRVPRFRIVQSMPHVLLTAAHGICAGAEAVCRRFRCVRLRAG
jgi:hypothetical protein